MAVNNVVAQANYKSIVGVVVNAGERLRTIRIRVVRQIWNERVQKHFATPHHVLVNDPNRSCNVGDVVRFRTGWRVSKHVKHVVSEIISPFGTPLEQRPAIAMEQQRVAERAARRMAKDKRQAERGRPAAIERLEQQKILEHQEAVQERAAADRLQAGDESLRTQIDEIIFSENDLDKIQIRIQDMICIQLSQHMRALLKDKVVTCLSLAVAYAHAAAKQEFIGVTLPLKAGMNPQSNILLEQRRLSETMKKQSTLFLDLLFPHQAGLTDTEQSGTLVLVKKAVIALQSRLAKTWKDGVFDSTATDTASIRQEGQTNTSATASTGQEKKIDWKSSLASHQSILPGLEYARSLENRIDVLTASANHSSLLDEVLKSLRLLNLSQRLDTDQGSSSA